MNFKELGIVDPILKALVEEGYTAPSPIQEQAIPHLLEGRDLLGCAQTGTGKTAAFAIPILQAIGEQHGGGHRPTRALILTPTRELAIQIEESFKAYGRHMNLRTVCIYGGVSQKPQVDQLKKGADIVVATPGRWNDLYEQGLIQTNKIDILVLDEADRMLDMGFIHDVRRIIRKLPENRQNLLFSATMPKEVQGLVNTILKNYVRIEVTPPASTVDTIEQMVYYVDKPNKPKLLRDLVQQGDMDSALVFTRTKHGADRVVRQLMKDKIKAAAIHGDKSQNARQRALEQFKSREIRVLVATDIAARGIDIEELSHVINYDIPNIPETYVHRIGRTGRAGLGGIAISFCMYEEMQYIRDIEKAIGKLLPEAPTQPYPMEIFQSETAPAPGPRPPRRPQSTRAFGGRGSRR
jgi:ATP-dependent RNA helicase RhlE